MDTAGRLGELRRRLAAASAPAARERVDALLDPGSFTEIDALAAGFVAGHGAVDGRPVWIYSQEPGLGPLGPASAASIHKVIDLALNTGCPVIGIHDAARTDSAQPATAQPATAQPDTPDHLRRPDAAEGGAPDATLGLSAALARRTIQAGGVVPQISLVAGPVDPAAAPAVALTDLLVRVADPERASPDDPGPDTDVTVPDLAAAVETVRLLLAYLPSNHLDDPPAYEPTAADQLAETDLALDDLVPGTANLPYDIRVALRAVLDGGDLLELAAEAAPNVVIGLGRIDGRTTGLVANQPMHLGGLLDTGAASKAARFVRMCDAFNIPLVTFVDTPGPSPAGRAGAQLTAAYAAATVPMVTVTVRHAHGGGHDAMACRQLGADVHVAWPTAQIAALPPPAAAVRHFAAEIAAATGAGEDPVHARARFAQLYLDTVAGPYAAAERGDIDAVIEPSETRLVLARTLRALSSKRVTGPGRALR